MKTHLYQVIIFFLGISLCANSCKKKILQELVKIDIQQIDDSLKLITINDSIEFVIDATVEDIIIHQEVAEIDKKLLYLQFKRDSLRTDSLQKINFKEVTKRVNGGYNGLLNREREWIRIKRILNDTIK